MITAVNEFIPAVPGAVDPEVEEMMAAGVHLGHAHAKRHPAMAPYLWGVRNNVEIIDLTKTKEKLAEALAFLRNAAKGSKLVLFVGTRPAAKNLIREIATDLEYPYVDQRWIGGTLTNFKVIFKRIETLEGLEEERTSGGFEKYAKIERLRKDAEINRLKESFDGLRRLRALPAAVVIIDIVHDQLALKEAKRLNIPVVALTDTNTNPRLVEYPIPSNDDAKRAVAYMLERIKSSILQGRGERDALPASGGVTPGGEMSEAPLGNA